MMKNKLGLYIHIPFCVKKCRYCDFLSFPSCEEEMNKYASFLVKEMTLWKETVSAYDVDTIFIGGGTPSLLPVKQMQIILGALADTFSLSALEEFSIECNPGTVTEDKLRLYREMGINRISFGMQSAQDDELASLGRIHTFDDFLQSYGMAGKQGFDNINIDLMSAIPGQTVSSYEDTLQKVLALEPTHISSYSLIIEEGTPFYELYADNPPIDEDTDRRMYELTEEYLDKAGFFRYEISNYAKNGFACKHNIKYWQRKPYLGLGLGASSFMEETRFSNEIDFETYCNKIAAKKMPVLESDKLTVADAKAEFMYLGLRMMEGVSEVAFEKMFSERLEDCYGEEIAKCERQGLLAREDDRVFLTKRGIDVSNRVFEEFI